MEVSFEDYGLRNLQAQITAHCLFIAYNNHESAMMDLVENLTDMISDAENKYQLDALLRTLIYLLEKIDDEVQIKHFHAYVSTIMQALLSAFTNSEIDVHGRELILQILFLNLRCISWADGIDNKLVEKCLNDTFNQWMTVFLQVIQSDSRKFFDLKRHALKCLTVIFRDFINYSRECINMIL